MIKVVVKGKINYRKALEQSKCESIGFPGVMKMRKHFYKQRQAKIGKKPSKC